MPPSPGTPLCPSLLSNKGKAELSKLWKQSISPLHLWFSWDPPVHAKKQPSRRSAHSHQCPTASSHFQSTDVRKDWALARHWAHGYSVRAENISRSQISLSARHYRSLSLEVPAAVSLDRHWYQEPKHRIWNTYSIFYKTVIETCISVNHKIYFSC